MPSKISTKFSSAERRAKQRRLFWVRLYIIVFFVLFFIFGLAILSGQSFWTIKTYIIEGNKTISTSRILEITNENTKGRYLALFARNNFLIYPREKIEQAIEKEFKTIKTIEVSWQAWQVVSINIVERKPYAVWCGESFNTDQACYFIDHSSFVFDQAPNFSGPIYLKFFGQVSEEGFYLKDEFGLLNSLIKKLSDINIEVRAAAFDGHDFTFYLSSGVKIIFNDRNGGIVKNFDNLFLALNSGNLDLHKNIESLDYVDLRFESRVVVGKRAGTK